jgi:hypothetical protein
MPEIEAVLAAGDVPGISSPEPETGRVEDSEAFVEAEALKYYLIHRQTSRLKERSHHLPGNLPLV